ncbi:YybS family protein [Pontibacillus marinus]|uniref:DUF2232 domain-containing protein n=1 Tax=Pontibacillus marinus BH030004 = DSM 16465 TaxID=1385511 RepID=A0A0A5G7X7_9BACI|nr:YybS family protein [Pontibacillus marinus]KGX89246.1 hypothetical protein N783_07035 [Pontibacillus marinus BH030004 = DSM 16465]
MKGSSFIREGLIYASIYLALLLISLFIPAIGLITMFLLPIPFLIFSRRNGWKASLVLISVVLFITALAVHIVTLPFTIVAGFGGIALGSALHQDKSPYEAWAQGTVGYVVGLLLTYLISLWLFNINWIEEIRKTIDQSIANSVELIESVSGDVSQEQLKALESQFGNIPSMLPSIMGILAISFAFITLWIGFKILNKQFREHHYFPPVKKLSFPRVIIWYYFIALLVTFIEFENGSIWGDAAQNVYVLTGALFTIQGFSFMFAYADIKGLSKKMPIIGVVISLLFSFLLLYPVRILGIIDLGFSLRERLANKK